VSSTKANEAKDSVEKLIGANIKRQKRRGNSQADVNKDGQDERAEEDNRQEAAVVRNATNGAESEPELGRKEETSVTDLEEQMLL